MICVKTLRICDASVYRRIFHTFVEIQFPFSDIRNFETIFASNRIVSKKLSQYSFTSNLRRVCALYARVDGYARAKD